MKTITKLQLKKLVESVVSEQSKPGSSKDLVEILNKHSQALIEDLYKEAERLYVAADETTNERIVDSYIRKGDFIVDNLIPKIISTSKEIRISIVRGL